MTLVAATRLGPYEIPGLLGAGGRCTAPSILALGARSHKLLPEETPSDRDRLKPFEREARVVATLNHPHVVAIHDVGSHEGTRSLS